MILMRSVRSRMVQKSVSYTHLDVYKRQGVKCSQFTLSLINRVIGLRGEIYICLIVPCLPVLMYRPMFRYYMYIYGCQRHYLICFGGCKKGSWNTRHNSAEGGAVAYVVTPRDRDDSTWGSQSVSCSCPYFFFGKRDILIKVVSSSQVHLVGTVSRKTCLVIWM